MRTFLKNLRTFFSLSWLPDPPMLAMMKDDEAMFRILMEEAVALDRARTNAERVARQQIMASRIRGSMRFQPDTIAESMLRCSRLPLRTPSKKRCCSRRTK